MTATVTLCPGITVPVSKVLNFGTPVALFDIYTYVPLNASCYEVDAFYIFKPTLTFGNYPSQSQYQWSYRQTGTTTETIIPSAGEDGVFIFSNTGSYDILLRPVNNCGVGNDVSIKTIDVVFSCFNGFRMNVSPNPANNDLVVVIEKEIKEVKNFKKMRKYYIHYLNLILVI